MPDASDFTTRLQSIAVYMNKVNMQGQGVKSNNITAALQFSQSRPQSKPRRTVVVPPIVPPVKPPVAPFEILNGGDARQTNPTRLLTGGGALSNINNLLTGGSSATSATWGTSAATAIAQTTYTAIAQTNDADIPMTNIANGAYLNSTKKSSVFIENTVKSS